MNTPFRPTPAQLAAAHALTLPDVITEGLRVLFVGINPGLYSAAVGHNFGRPGNRFWPTLFRAGFTPRLFSPFDEQTLLTLGLGITNLVERATARADELSREELQQGKQRLEQKVLTFRPRAVAVLGVSAYRTAFAQPKGKLGRQQEPFGGALLWVLPNPSGLNAHHQLADLARLFAELREALPHG
jgi:TDG/mug DNA glycosylase family protein